MNTLNEYLTLPYRLEIVPDTEEGGFVANYLNTLNVKESA